MNVSSGSYFFSTIGGKVEHKNGEKRDTHARYNEVHCVEEGFPPHRYVKCDIEVRFITARVELLVPENKKMRFS